MPYAASRSSRRSGVVRIRSSVPDTRSRCIVIDVIRNITISGNTPSMIRQALLNGDGVPGGCGAVLEHEVHQRDDQARGHQDHRDAAMIGGQLAQDPGGRREVAPRAQRAQPVLLRCRAG